MSKFQELLDDALDEATDKGITTGLNFALDWIRRLDPIVLDTGVKMKNHAISWVEYEIRSRAETKNDRS